MIVMRRFLFWGIWALVMLCCCCTGNQVYDHYQNVPISGWDKADVLSYDVTALRDSGWYATDLGLRMNNMYPFLSVTMVVSQAVYHPTAAGKKEPYLQPSMVKNDTINCSLRDDNGKVKGQGIIFYQYHYHVSAMKLQQGDSLHITVRHLMKREILPGLSDIGISMRRMMK